MKARSPAAFLAVVAILATVACNKQEGPVREAVSHKDDYQLAYIYGFPMIAGYKAMYQFAIDKTVLATTNPNREARQQEDVMNYKTLITSVARGTGRRLVRSDLNRYTEGGDAGWQAPATIGQARHFLLRRRGMKRLFVFAFALALLYVTVGSAQQYPIMDKVADKVIQKYQTSTCEQLWEKKSQKAPPSAEEQKAIQLLKGDPQMRAAFINKIAAPIANKMFECGMIP